MLNSDITALLILHIACGIAAMGSGFTALFVRKGSPVHRAGGRVFVGAMLVGAVTASILGYDAEPRDYADVISGVLTFYLVATAWVTARRSAHQTGAFEIGACVVAASGAAGGFVHTTMAVSAGTALLGGVPGFIFASVAAAAAALDLSVIVRGGLGERQRIARHLWRMSLGFFIAVGSFFPGQIHLFPAEVQEVRPIILLFAPALLIVAIMFFWLFRVLWTRTPALIGTAGHRQS